MSLFTSILATIEAQVLKKQETPIAVAIFVSEILGVTVNTEQIVIKDGVLRLMIPATLKLAIKLKQETLLEGLKVYNISKIL